MQYRQGVTIVGKRTVEIDDANEAKLADLEKITGLSVSEIVNQCLSTYADAIGAGTTDWEALSNPYEYYLTLDLGPGGYSYGPAERMEELLPKIIREKHQAKRDDTH